MRFREIALSFVKYNHVRPHSFMSTVTIPGERRRIRFSGTTIFLFAVICDFFAINVTKALDRNTYYMRRKRHEKRENK